MDTPKRQTSRTAGFLVRSAEPAPPAWRRGLPVLVALALLPPLLLSITRAAPLPRLMEHQNYTETIPGTKVRFDMVAVPGGTFVMGSPAGEAGRRDDEGPPHPVTLRPFWMGRTEVTWDEFDLYAKKPAAKPRVQPDDADAVTRPSQPYVDETWGFGRKGHPVIGISHHTAREYCRWLSAATGKAYRLPTEAEWEYACRAGSKSAYGFGDDPAALDAHGWYDKNALESTHPVGQKRPNAWGLHDMHGNVAEWCLDHYERDYYRIFPRNEPSPVPVNLPTAARYAHVVRGGSWATRAADCRSASRRGSDKSWNKRDPKDPPSIWWLSDADFVGFRVVRAVEEQPNLRGLRSQVTRDSK